MSWNISKSKRRINRRFSVLLTHVSDVFACVLTVIWVGYYTGLWGTERPEIMMVSHFQETNKRQCTYRHVFGVVHRSEQHWFFLENLSYDRLLGTIWVYFLVGEVHRRAHTREKYFLKNTHRFYGVDSKIYFQKVEIPRHFDLIPSDRFTKQFQ